jgi:hypothetical protein
LQLKNFGWLQLINTVQAASLCIEAGSNNHQTNAMLTPRTRECNVRKLTLQLDKTTRFFYQKTELD